MASIIVDYSSVIGPVNHDLFGNNIVAYTKKYYNGLYRNRGAGVWDPDNNQPVSAFVEAAKSAGHTVLRWPGGKNAWFLDWESTVGPLSNRPNQKFGLPEFLKFCEEVGAKPVITLSSTVHPEDASNLVEYLNAEDDGSNPNGRKEWAALRAGDGRKKPWGVRWFEFGNESFHRGLTTDEYVQRFRKVQQAMKSVDPKIELGAVLEDSDTVEDGWTHTILRELGRKADFAIIHPYIIKLYKGPAKHLSKEKVALATLSSDANLAWRLRRYRQAIREATGEDKLPIAVSEYNGLFVQDDPIPYRHTLLNALYNADNLRVFLDPDNRILFATFWQFANGFWGIVRGGLTDNDPLVKQPMQYVFELYKEYLGNELVRADVDSGVFRFGGVLGISAREGLSEPEREVAVTEDIPDSWSRRLFLDGDQSQDNGIVRVRFSGNKRVDYYHAFKKIKVDPDTLYYITVKVRSSDLTGGKVGIAVQDARGWKHDFYQPRNTPITGTTDWQDVTVPFRTLPDTHEIMVLARSGGKVKLKGIAEFGVLSLHKAEGNFGAVPKLSVLASRNEADGMLYLLVLNKDMNASIRTEIQVQGGDGDFKPLGAKRLEGKSVFSTNLSGKGSEEVVVRPVSIDKKGSNKYSVIVPPFSLTAISFGKVD